MNKPSTDSNLRAPLGESSSPSSTMRTVRTKTTLIMAHRFEPREYLPDLALYG